MKANSTVKLEFKLKKPGKTILQNLGLVKDEAKFPASRASKTVCYEMAPSACDQTGGYYLPPDYNTEEYSRIYENRFLEVTQNPLSTFSIDVDPASYANVRRFLNYGQMPPKDAVRIEELINYFDYNYPLPDDGRPFSIITNAGPCPWNNGHRLVRIGIKGKEISRDNCPPPIWSS